LPTTCPAVRRGGNLAARPGADSWNTRSRRLNPGSGCSPRPATATPSRGGRAPAPRWRGTSAPARRGRRP
jgi:hypothetical protein